MGNTYGSTVADWSSAFFSRKGQYVDSVLKLVALANAAKLSILE
jgi:hypothetical protein